MWYGCKFKQSKGLNNGNFYCFWFCGFIFRVIAFGSVALFLGLGILTTKYA